MASVFTAMIVGARCDKTVGTREMFPRTKLQTMQQDDSLKVLSTAVWPSLGGCFAWAMVQPFRNL